MIVKDFLLNNLKGVLKDMQLDNGNACISFSQMQNIADFQSSVALSLSKTARRSPMELAEKISNNLRKIVQLKNYEITVSEPGFINFKLSDLAVSNIANELYLEKDRIGIARTNNPQNIILDYGGANVAKELHMGHLRSPIIGESIKRLNEFFGNNCISDTHLGDWGLQMGLTIAELEEEGILDFYFKNKGKEPKITLDMLNTAYPKASAKSKIDAKFKKKADDYTLYLQQKRQPYYNIWQIIREVSVDKIKQNYADLNCTFDLWYGESTANSKIEQTMDIFKAKRLLRESEGALVVDIAREGEHIPIPKKTFDEVQRYVNPMPPAVIQKHNGGELYITTDLATILQRLEMYPNTNKIIYITDMRQAGHFTQVFRCAKLANIAPKEVELVHVGFGTMNGNDGKPFKTRDGGVLKLDDVVQSLKAKASEKLAQNNVVDFDNLALKIGVAALKFGDLTNVVTKDYVLDLDKFMSFDGKTGPYLQYTATRIRSLLHKANFEPKNNNLIFCKLDEEKNIIMSILKLQDAFAQALADNSLHSICLAVYNLCSAYSVFYNNIRILTEQDEKKKQSYLNLSYLTYSAIKVALDILAIDIPDKM